MEERELNELLERYRTGQSTPEDKAFLESWYLTYNQSDPFTMKDEDRAKDLDSVWMLIQPKQAFLKKMSLWYCIAAAAIVLVFISAGSYFLLYPKNGVSTNIVAKNDVAPGKNKATLTLANGKKLVLGNAITGQLAHEAGVVISKTKNGELIYTSGAADNKAVSPGPFNMLETSRGEQYRLILPDGTHVWLNAASSLKYPVVFGDKERLVELKGEAYFEVFHNKTMPFRVKTEQQVVEVLGTHFNVDAYSDEKATATTLMEGSVKITAVTNHKNIIIKPGQQSTVSTLGVNVQQVDPDEALAWKNGYFQFNDENLESIMRKVSRWYNVDVEYKDNAPLSLVFSGTVSKYKNVSQVTRILELTNAVHFKIDGNKIIVSN
ncbi:FecR domain-containing protein [Mucilaginibacter sp.]|uniref:FecR family protein n=1 Tax=Mucilaginibacter sp. TaxID=1882438 RepID=UPI002610D4C1|nr:FecR domain-containing protein [Mucilaginibacter sp.]MDB4919682.1 FecR protein [Mucilaginibacter sp.]